MKVEFILKNQSDGKSEAFEADLVAVPHENDLVEREDRQYWVTEVVWVPFDKSGPYAQVRAIG